MRLKAILVGLLVAALLPAGQALAIQGIGVSPTSKELKLMPGDTTKGEITVINDGDTDVKYKVYAADYRVSGEDYHGVFTNSGSGTQVSPVSWLVLPTGTYTAKAREESTFPYTVIVPKNAAVGGHYGAIFVQTIPPAAGGAAVINRVDRVASLLYMAVGGGLNQSGRVVGLDVPWLQALPPVQGALRIRNDGNVHFQADVTAQLATPFGDVGKPEQIRGEVLPGTTRKFELSLPSSSPIGLYKLTAKATYLGKTETRSGWLLLVPRLTFLIVAGTLMLLVILAVWSWIRRVRRRHRAA